MKSIDKFKNTALRIFILSILVLTSGRNWAQQQGAPPLDVKPEPSPYSDPLFWILASVALILLVFISQMGKLFVAVIKNFAKKGSGKVTMIVATFVASMFISNDSVAQVADNAAKAEEAVPFLHHGFGNMQLNILAVIIAIELIVVLYYAFLIKRFLVKEAEAAPYVERKSKPFWDRFNKSVAIEKEAAILTDHDYDGIKELDNNLPPWWKYGFYLTIVWSVVYLAHYHVWGTGALQLQELKNEEDNAILQLAQFEKTQKNKVDETTVVFMSSAQDLAKGKALFTEKTCVVCHGSNGEGKNGPNLTDNYWLHGGSIKDIFKTIKYGVPEKGMRSWKADINAPDMALISSYIISLQGTNPPGAIAPQGTVYIPEEGKSEPANDLKNDSSETAVIDTTKGSQK